MSTSLQQVLARIGQGEFLDAIDFKMQDLVSAVDETGKPGTLTIVISLKKASRGGAMNVTGKAIVKKPAEELMEALLFATADGELVADDPKQHKLDLTNADNTPAALSQLRKV